MTKQRLCRICKKRTPWRHENCPPGICKRCYHKHVWADRPGARRLSAAESAARAAADRPDE